MSPAVASGALLVSDDVRRVRNLMDIVSIFRDLFTDYTLRTVALGSAMLGLVSGVLGVFAVLRRQSLLGDAISHAALPGVALAFLITGSKEPLVLALGAIAAGWLATVLVLQVTGNTRIKADAALGIALAVFFGFGLLLLTFIQRLPNAAKAGLDKFLFGQAATLLGRDLVTMASARRGRARCCVMLFWKEFKLLTFDPGVRGEPRLSGAAARDAADHVDGRRDRRRNPDGRRRADERNARRSGRGSTPVDREAERDGAPGRRYSARVSGYSERGKQCRAPAAHRPNRRRGS